MNILNFINDEQLALPFFGDEISKSWKPWLTALRVLYGLPIRANKSKALISDCTGRPASSLPEEGFQDALFITGRRSGKSRIAATIGAFEAAFAGHEKKLDVGERGLVSICAPTSKQSRVVKGYIKGLFDKSPPLSGMITRETKEGFDLENNISIEILVGDHRSVRGYSLVAAIVDEAAFFGVDLESRVKSDTELIRALKPALATSQGRLIAITSPYARKGWVWNTFKKHHGNDAGSTLVWNAPSRTMNPTLSQKIIDDALQDDLAFAKSEYLGEFRDDVAAFLSREAVEQCVIEGRTENYPDSDITYSAFVDISGGRSDASALAISHKTDGRVVIDYLGIWKAPNNPHLVIREMAEDLQRYGCKSVTGDKYSANFVADAFKANRVRYDFAEQNKSQLYLELLPLITSGEIELLDNLTLINQLCNLERRTRSGGRDLIDHPPNQKDDVANAVAGVAAMANTQVIWVGGLGL